MKSNNKEVGYLGEQEFIKRLEQEGVPYIYVDSWYDFLIYDTEVEVKTCVLSHKFAMRNKKQVYKIGRFEFTQEQRENRLYTAFFIRHKREYLFLGIGKLPMRCPKYISIHKTRELTLYTLPEFISLIKK